MLCAIDDEQSMNECHSLIKQYTQSNFEGLPFIAFKNSITEKMLDG